MSIACIQVADVSARTSTNVPGGSRSTTGAPAMLASGPSSRRSWLRFQLSALSGSSASANSSSASHSRPGAASVVSRYANSPQPLRPRGGGSA
jgi:hypothetical protein